MADRIGTEDAGRAAKMLLGRAPERLEAFRPTEGGDTSYNFRLWSGDQAMLLKIMRRPGAPIGVYFHRRIRAAGMPLRDVPCRLLHMGDIMNGSNLLLDPVTGHIRAVLDYVESTAGDPRWELAWFDYYFEQFPFQAEPFDLARFRAAYGTDHDPNDPVGRFYLAAILVFEKLLWFPAN